MQMFGQESVKNMRDLTEKEERAAFGKRLKRKEVWTAEYRLKQAPLRLLAGTAASAKRLHKYSRLEAANTEYQSYSLMKSRAQDTAPALEAPDTEHIGGSKSRAGIKFRRNERSMDGGIPPESGRRCAYSPEQRRALNDYTNIRGWKPRTQDTNHTRS